MDNVDFSNLGLSENLLRAIRDAGYQKPSPIQARAIPAILAGRDIFGCAQTGTGKTAAFALPIMQKLETSGNYPRPQQFRALILTPTRELAEQIGANVSMFGKHLNLSYCKAYGGVSLKPQIRALSTGVDILVATPGRLLDLFNQKKLSFDGVEYLVLDEADRMLDMGFLPDIRRICSHLPNRRQSLLFSATLSEDIEKLARSIVSNPLKISISPDKPTVEKIDQKAAMLESPNKYNFLLELLEPKADDKNFLALIFCRTKHGASKLAKRLSRDGVKADSIHGDKSQSARQKALGKFKDRAIRALVATDIAARGIDVKNMNLVVNYDLPDEVETYVHRIGRTARAEASGEAVSLCTRDNVQEFCAIEKFIKLDIPLYKDTQYHSENVFELVQKQRALRAKVAKKRGQAQRPKRVKDADFSAEILYGERRPSVFKANPDAQKPQHRSGAKRGKPSDGKHFGGANEKNPYSNGAFSAKKFGIKTEQNKHKNSGHSAHQKPTRPQKQRRIRGKFVSN